MADASDVLKDLKDVRSWSPSYFILVHQSGSCRAQMNPGGGLQTTASSTLTAVAISGCGTFASSMCWAAIDFRKVFMSIAVKRESETVCILME